MHKGHSEASFEYTRCWQVILPKSEDVKPSMASDLLSDNSVSLMGAVLYYIDADWIGL